MPNWTENTLVFEDEEIASEMFKKLTGKNEELDFGIIVPQPKELDVPSSTDWQLAYDLKYAKNPEDTYTIPIFHPVKGRRVGERTVSVQEACEYYREAQDISAPLGGPYFDDRADIYHFNFVTYGHHTWYSWCNAEWGTKWNASGTFYDGGPEIVFDTPWCPPVPYYEALAEKYPHLYMHAYWSDEGSYERSQVFEHVP